MHTKEKEMSEQSLGVVTSLTPVHRHIFGTVPLIFLKTNVALAVKYPQLTRGMCFPSFISPHSLT